MSNSQPTLFASDLEGVFIPEVWIAVAEKIGIEKLRLTTRDVANYDELMQMRLRILQEHRLTLHDIQNVIETMEPLPGAVDFLDWAREHTRVIILTDSYYEFVQPFMAKMHYPAVFAHQLETDKNGMIINYHLRTDDGKRKAVHQFKEQGFRTMAVGDSYNDTKMLLAADDATLFCPPDNVISEFPQLPVVTNHKQLRTYVEGFLGIV